jgi:hypothetical protein
MEAQGAETPDVGSLGKPGRMRHSGRMMRILMVLACALSLPLASAAQFAPQTAPQRAARPGSEMVPPTIDEDPGLFSYFSRSTDEIGVMDGRAGSEITPEGSVYTGFGELMFFVGPEQAPISARVRTLEDGFLPVVRYTVEHLGIEYGFTIFAARVAGGPVVNFVRVTMRNPGRSPRAAFLTTALRYQGEQTTETPTGDNRFKRPIPATGVGQFDQPGEVFSNTWMYSVGGDAFLRDGRAMYLFPAQPAPRLSLTLRSHYNRSQSLGPARLDVQPTTPTSVAAYTVELAPGESRSLDFKMPLLPTEAGSAEYKEVEAARFDEAHAATLRLWRQTLDRGMKIEVPEPKVVETFRASLVYDLLALDMVDGATVQTVNDFQYHRFYLRDAADFVRMYDATGYPEIAARVLSLFPSRQQPDGNFLSQPGQYDGWGEAMWAFGEHFRRTHDVAFANSIYPGVVRAVDWLAKARAADPLHVMPMSDVRDNEYVSAHLTGYNFLALGGLQSAIELAKATGHAADAARFQAEYDDYHRTFFTLLDAITKKTGGYIPPALDAPAGGWGGTDWGNLLAVTPVPLLDPHDARVTATLQKAQARYKEGIATYSEPDDGEFLHHYLTIKNTLTELVRGDQEQAIREFYAELLHTSSTHTGFEYAIRPWGSRDFEGNLAPHGWFAADYRNLLRNMMVREEGDTLHLLSAVSPEWIGAGKRIAVTRAPTEFGPIDFALEMPAETTATLHIQAAWTSAPEAMVLHLPWFMQAASITADGVPVPLADGQVSLPPGTKLVNIIWQRRPGASRMSFVRTVASYKAEYRRRYKHLLETGEAATDGDSWRVPE